MSLESEIENYKGLEYAENNSTIAKKDTNGDIASFFEGITSINKGSEEAASELLNNGTRGIFGMPYQFMNSVDSRISGTTVGRKYAEKIVSALPLLLLTPGKPKFMKGYSKADKNSLLKAITQKAEDTISTLLNSETDGKFYSFEFAYAKYFDIVNSMCRKLATLMNLGDRKIDGVPLSTYDWSQYGKNGLSSYVGSAECVAFYVDAETNMTESFSNDTSASMLASSVNGMSDTAREIQFLMGSGGVEFEALQKENYDASLEKLNSFTSKFSSILPDGLTSKLSQGILTVATGGKMYFPEIWSDSQFSQSYDVSIKLRTPDQDDLSIYLNLFVPTIFLVSMSAAQQLGANGYQSPFLVRGYYAGHFNVNMGIIPSLSITKGDRGMFTQSGLPTQIDISLTIKDLYNVFSVTGSTKIIDNLNNTGMLDYLANMAGINVNKVDISRSIDIFFSSVGNGIIDKLIRNRVLSVKNYIGNTISNIFNSR